MSRIISIGTAVPQFAAKQADILKYMCDAYQDETDSRKLRILFHSSGIDSRYSVLPDFGQHREKRELFFGEEKPDVEKRMQVYQKNAPALAFNAIENAFINIKRDIKTFGITHLITVTCTGLYAPGIETELMQHLDLPNDIFHTSVNYHGCNAAFPALRMANSFVKSEKNAKVLVVCVELCTIHFQPKNDQDNLLSNTIFGDGAAAVVVVSDEFAHKKNLRGLAINGFYTNLLEKGKHLMGWNIKPLNFEMVLNAKVPAFIGEQISRFISRAGQALKISPENIDKWAIHPGGRKILDVVKNNLSLTADEMQFSYRVLNNYGNMSSPTVLFILQQIMNQELNPDENILAIGFGPGIKIDVALLHYVE